MAFSLSVSCLGDLCLALRLSVCRLFVRIMLGIGFVCLFVCWMGDLCLALRLSVICGNYVGHWVLSVCWLGHLCLVMVGLFATGTAD